MVEAAIADVQQVRPLAAEGVVDRGAVRDQALAALLRALQAHQPGDVGAVAVELERDPRVIAAGPAVVVRSEEHTSELQSLMRISYAVFCLTKKNKQNKQQTNRRHNREQTVLSTTVHRQQA